MISIIAIIGARPQFVKHAGLLLASPSFPDLKINSLHTGQHYDHEMDGLFFKEFHLPKPEFKFLLKAQKGIAQFSEMMLNIEEVLSSNRPKGVIVYGDTNSTLAGALVAVKMGIPIFHIESGLRSNDRTMPEEINRIIVDHISNVLFVPSTAALSNCQNENLIGEKILVGDIMKDICLTTIKHLTKIDKTFIYATLHRPSNVDNQERLESILKILNQLKHPVVFSLHPRTKKRLQNFEIDSSNYNNIKFIPPQSYQNNLNYMQSSLFLITDSGGMQKEAYWLKKQCITIRKTTEWIETLQGHWNQLSYDLDHLLAIRNKPEPAKFRNNLYGNGETAHKILNHIQSYFSGSNGNNSETRN